MGPPRAATRTLEGVQSATRRRTEYAGIPVVELDVWEYIGAEGIEVVPLYFAAVRPVVQRNGLLLMVDDGRMPILPGERVEQRLVRFRTLASSPLSGAVESTATSVDAVIDELRRTRDSERSGRAIDHDTIASMEKKKREGYF